MTPQTSSTSRTLSQGLRRRCFNWMMNQIFTWEMVVSLNIHLKKCCLEFQVDILHGLDITHYGSATTYVILGEVKGGKQPNAATVA